MSPPTSTAMALSRYSLVSIIAVRRYCFRLPPAASARSSAVPASAASAMHWVTVELELSERAALPRRLPAEMFEEFYYDELAGEMKGGTGVGDELPLVEQRPGDLALLEARDDRVTRRRRPPPSRTGFRGKSSSE